MQQQYMHQQAPDMPDMRGVAAAVGPTNKRTAAAKA